MASAELPDGFLNEWPYINARLPNVLQLFNKRVSTKWNSDVKSVLMLLKLLPFTPHRSKSQAKKMPTTYVSDCFIDLIKV